MSALTERLKTALDANDGRIPYSFIDDEIATSEIIYLHPTKNMRLCIIRLQSGHEVIGVAQVLTAANDVEVIGNSVALQNATNELWKVFGSIALSL